MTFRLLMNGQQTDCLLCMYGTHGARIEWSVLGLRVCLIWYCWFCCSSAVQMIEMIHDMSLTCYLLSVQIICTVSVSESRLSSSLWVKFKPSEGTDSDSLLLLPPLQRPAEYTATVCISKKLPPANKQAKHGEIPPRSRCSYRVYREAALLH